MSKREAQRVRATDGKTYLVKAEDYELAEKMHEMWKDFSDDVDENARRIAIYVAVLRSRAEKAEAALEEAERERDQAILHDRQPYPTAEAYEAVCAARTKWQERAEKAEAALELMVDAATGSGDATQALSLARALLGKLGGPTEERTCATCGWDTGVACSSTKRCGPTDGGLSDHRNWKPKPAEARGPEVGE